jgi:hypothetical protein
MTGVNGVNHRSGRCRAADIRRRHAPYLPDLEPQNRETVGIFLRLGCNTGVYRNTLSPLIEKAETELPELLGRDRIKVAAALETLRCGLADAPVKSQLTNSLSWRRRQPHVGDGGGHYSSALAQDISRGSQGRVFAVAAVAISDSARTVLAHATQHWQSPAS